MAVVDAEQISDAKGKIENLIREQIRVSDAVIINKIDLITSKAAVDKSWRAGFEGHCRRKHGLFNHEHCHVPIDFIHGAGCIWPPDVRSIKVVTAYMCIQRGWIGRA